MNSTCHGQYLARSTAAILSCATWGCFGGVFGRISTTKPLLREKFPTSLGKSVLRSHAPSCCPCSSGLSMAMTRPLVFAS